MKGLILLTSRLREQAVFKPSLERPAGFLDERRSRGGGWCGQSREQKPGGRDTQRGAQGSVLAAGSFSNFLFSPLFSVESFLPWPCDFRAHEGAFPSTYKTFQLLAHQGRLEAPLSTPPQSRFPQSHRLPQSAPLRPPFQGRRFNSF